MVVIVELEEVVVGRVVVEVEVDTEPELPPPEGSALVAGGAVTGGAVVGGLVAGGLVVGGAVVSVDSPHGD